MEDTLPDYRRTTRPLEGRQFRARFWGVRGTHPAALSAGTRYGGNTTCLEVRYGWHILIIDAGSGIVPLGDELTRELGRRQAAGERPPITMLFTHAHHDHLCGLPFFAPLYQGESRLHMLGPDLADMRFEEIIAGYMRSPYFPVDFKDLPSERHLTSIDDGVRLIWPPDAHGPIIGDQATTTPLGSLVVDALHSEFHPRNGTLIYRLRAEGRSLAFATDIEFGAAEERQYSQAEQRYLNFIRGVDVLVHDAQYSEDDYTGAVAAPTRGYGHSTSIMAARVAKAAGVGSLVLFHHDPGYSDDDIDVREQEARQVFAATSSAREGAEILLDATLDRHI